MAFSGLGVIAPPPPGDSGEYSYATGSGSSTPTTQPTTTEYPPPPTVYPLQPVDFAQPSQPADTTVTEPTQPVSPSVLYVPTPTEPVATPTFQTAGPAPTGIPTWVWIAGGVALWLLKGAAVGYGVHRYRRSRAAARA